MQKSESIVKIASALVKAQSKIGNPIKNQSAANNGKKMYDYANITGYIEETKPKLAECGITVMQFTRTKEDLLGIETILLHESGEFISEEFYINDKVKALYNGNPLQNMGSILTYLRRYAITAMLYMGADDDDGAVVSNGFKTNNKPQQQQQPQKPNNNYNQELIAIKKEVVEALQNRGVELNDHIKEKLSLLKKFELETVIKKCKSGENPLDAIDGVKK